MMWANVLKSPSRLLQGNNKVAFMFWLMSKVCPGFAGIRHSRCSDTGIQGGYTGPSGLPTILQIVCLQAHKCKALLLKDPARRNI